MSIAIQIAKQAKIEDKLPYGCIIVDPDQRIIGYGKGSGTDIRPLIHSEMIAISQACLERNGLLQDCSLYQTFQPCPMCAGAIAHAKISRIIYGASRADLPNIFRQKKINCEDILAETTPNPYIIGGILREECIALFSMSQNSKAGRIQKYPTRSEGEKTPVD